MSTRTGVLIGGGVVLLAVVLYLVIALPGAQPRTEDPTEPPPSSAKAETPPRPGVSPPPPLARRPDASAGSVAAPSDIGAAAQPSSDAKPNRFGTAAKPGSAAQAAREAMVKQRDMYRASIASSTQRIEALTKVIERLRKSGAATPEQLTQIQRQLQQHVDALPRLKERLQRLDGEVEAEQAKKQEEEKQP